MPCLSLSTPFLNFCVYKAPSLPTNMDDAKPLDLSKFQNRTTILVGSPTTATSAFVRDILRQINVAKGIVTSRQPSSFLPECIPPESVLLHSEFVPEAHRSDDRTPMFAVFDNCFVDNSWMQERSIHMYFHANRTYQRTAIFVLPRIKRLSPGLRANIDFLCLGKIAEGEAKWIYDMFFQFTADEAKEGTITFPNYLELVQDDRFLILQLDSPTLQHYPYTS